MTVAHRGTTEVVQSLRDRLPRFDAGFGALSAQLFAPGYRIELPPGENEQAPVLLSWDWLPQPPTTTLVEFETEAGRLWLDAARSNDSNAQLPHWRDFAREDARLLAWLLSEETLVAQLGAAFACTLQARRLVATTQAADDGTGLWLLLHIDEGGERRRSVAAGIETSLLSRLCLHSQRSARPPRQRRFDALPLPLSVSLIGPALRRRQVASLAIGDVLVIGQRSTAATSLLLRDPAAQSTLAWSAHQVDGGRARITGPLPPWPNRHKENAIVSETESAPPSQADEAAAQPSDHPADRVPVQIEFELGHLQITLGELGQIEPGYVFELPQRIDQGVVRIRANGNVIARGELVAIGDLLGVRLLNWDGDGRRDD